MEEVSGKLFFLPIMLAYNRLLPNHPAYIHCPGPGGGGDGWKGQKVEYVSEIPRKVQRPCICQAKACSAPVLNRLKRPSTRVSRLPPWLSNFSSQIQFPPWQNDSFHENIWSILPACKNPLKYTMNPYCLDPQDVLGSQGFLPSNRSWGKPRWSQKGEITQTRARLPGPKD